MKTSQKCIDMIKKYEGLRLGAYLCPANVWTIGYGHTGADVFRGKTITAGTAETLLRGDLVKFETAVTGTGLKLNQNQFDALVSFAYNCGAGNLRTLIKNRSLAQIADAIPLYNKGGGRVLAGLVRRRKEERELFLSAPSGAPSRNLTAAESNPYPVPVVNLKSGAKGDSVKWLQTELNRHGYGLTVDGIFGAKTAKAVKDYQTGRGLVADGIVGPLTRAKLNS